MCDLRHHGSDALRNSDVSDITVSIPDASNIAVEVPVYILPKEAKDLEISEPLTGHIDILQYRNNKIYVLDYKPDRNPKLAQTQLRLYKRAFSARAGVPWDDIRTAAFNENGYIEFGTE